MEAGAFFRRFSLIGLVLFAGVALAESPKSRFEEKSRRTLMQLDVTVEGPAEVISALTPEDFDVLLGGRKIREFSIDRFCTGQEKEDPSADDPLSPIDTPADRKTPSASYLFYFDQHHLTFSGRNQSIALAHELIDDLVRDGNRATIVSAGLHMRTFAPLTDDRALLHRALDAVRRDRDQLDEYPMQEDGRVRKVLDEFETFMDAAQSSTSAGASFTRYANAQQLPLELMRGTLDSQVNASFSAAVTAAQGVARDFQREEWWRAERALTQFSMALQRMSNFEFPKAVVYFADTVRSNAGEHYLGLLGTEDSWMALAGLPVVSMPSVGSITGTPVPAFDRVIEEAAAQGARLYTVQAEGFNGRLPMSGSTGLMAASLGTGSTSALEQRFSDAERSLISFAKETGGQAFLKGRSAERIAEQILGDMDCVYLVSFDPQDFPLDRSLPVRVVVRKPGVTIRARGLVTIRSDSAQLTSKLEAAFSAPEEVQGGEALVGLVIPVGFESGKYTALVQLIIPGAPRPRMDWDVGVSVTSGGRVREATSSSVSVRGRDLPVVYETVIRLAPGPWELTGVAHDSERGTISAVHVEGDWRDPLDERAVVGPIALLQPVYAAFLRDGRTRQEGSLGRTGTEPIRTDLPTALVGLVCRNRAERGALSVERRLVGDTFVDFPDLDLTPDRGRCVVVSDVIPAGTMTEGWFTYELRVTSEEEDVASGTRELAALEPGP